MSGLRSLDRSLDDLQSNPLTMTDAANQVATFTYDARGLLPSTWDALNQTTTFTYDALARLLMSRPPVR